MDDTDALDGGAERTRWQKRHAKRKAREAAKKIRAIERADLERDFVKRMKKWRARVAEAKANGGPIPHRRTKPHKFKHKSINMSGQRYGRLTVIRRAVVTERVRNQGIFWWVSCACGSPERRVLGNGLRQGKTQSCGCWSRELSRARMLARQSKRREAAAKPLSDRLLQYQRKVCGENTRTRLARLLIEARRLAIRDEIARGIRGPKFSAWYIRRLARRREERRLAAQTRGQVLN